jgi:hypothetical protein
MVAAINFEIFETGCDRDCKPPSSALEATGQGGQARARAQAAARLQPLKI